MLGLKTNMLLICAVAENWHAKRRGPTGVGALAYDDGGGEIDCALLVPIVRDREAVYPIRVLSGVRGTGTGINPIS